MTDFWQHRKIRKTGRELLHHARHVRYMREDILSASSVDRVKAAESELESALRSRNWKRVETAMGSLESAIGAIHPAVSFPVLRENIEIIVVAVAVAMAFRTYFIQPFKIPTGSMQPTLYGIHYESHDAPEFTDRFPFKPIKWLLVGAWYREFRAKSWGVIDGPVGEDPNGMLLYKISGVSHALPRDLPCKFARGDEIVPGQILAQGTQVTGDHIFVNKVKWNFVRPRRDQIIVFNTNRIPGLDAKKTHYIKRLVGLPGETVAIDPPCLRINGQVPVGYRGITRIQQHPGYRLAHREHGGQYLVSTNDAIRLSESQYFALGDNTPNSYDGRYWGPVPQDNLVGPACFVYWPLSRRWGTTP